MRVSRTAATAIGLTSIVLWGAQALLATYAAGFPPFETVAIVFGVGFAMMLAKWLWRGEDVLAHARFGALVWLLGVGGLFGYYALFYLALHYAPAIEVTLLVNVWPLIFVALTGLLPDERLRWPHVFGCLCGAAGTVVLLGDRLGGALDLRALAGAAIALAAALVWSLYSVLSRVVGKVPTDAVGWYCFGTALLALVCHVVLEPPHASVAWSGWVAVGLIGIGPIGLALVAWDFGMKHGNMRLLGIGAFFIPLLSAGLLVAAGRAVADWHVGVASCLIAGGAIVAAAGELGAGTMPAVASPADPDGTLS